MELTARGDTFAEEEIQTGVFQEDALSPLLIVKVMMPLNRILGKCLGGYRFTESQEKINPPHLQGQHQTVYKK